MYIYNYNKIVWLYPDHKCDKLTVSNVYYFVSLFPIYKILAMVLFK